MTRRWLGNALILAAALAMPTTAAWVWLKTDLRK